MRLASLVAEEFHFGGVQRYEYLHLLHVWHLPTKLACEAHLGKQPKDAFYIKLNRNLDSRTTALENDAARIPKGSIGGRPIEVNGGGLCRRNSWYSLRSFSGATGSALGAKSEDQKIAAFGKSYRRLRGVFRRWISGCQKQQRPAFLRALVLFGAGTRSRTRDLLITSQLLYQLSYTGVLGRRL